eukprot:707708-Rhodomonas_salina.4
MTCAMLPPVRSEAMLLPGISGTDVCYAAASTDACYAATRGSEQGHVRKTAMHVIGYAISLRRRSEMPGTHIANAVRALQLPRVPAVETEPGTLRIQIHTTIFPAHFVPGSWSFSFDFAVYALPRNTVCGPWY